VGYQFDPTLDRKSYHIIIQNTQPQKIEITTPFSVSSLNGRGVYMHTRKRINLLRVFDHPQKKMIILHIDSYAVRVLYAYNMLEYN